MFPLIRRLLFMLPPEAAHRLALAVLRAWGEVAKAPAVTKPVRVMGLDFPNRVGLAAGLDKDAVAVRGFANLGFGFVEVGTVTPRPQPGNPKPRLFRSSRDRALINRMGFNSDGMRVVRERLVQLRRRPLRTLVGVNIGKNRDTPLADALDDYRRGLAAMHDVADYVTVNISSPNTPGLRDLQAGDAAERLLATLARERDVLGQASGGRVPLAVKVAPDLDSDGLRDIAAVVRETGIDAVIAGNTTLSRPGGLDETFAKQQGGLSGAPLAPLALDTVANLREALGPEVPIIGVGGVLDPEAGRAMRCAGADLVQVYTGLIFAGPGLVRGLRAVLDDAPRQEPRGGQESGHES
ncbi:MAG: quinone-dependent dihydroorotate dehydrogenase [Gammaproteobacteria bacterium]|nr:quinone-dependent dihydroorotate dehydrogenase [Gammaproteobacteria bacterium]